MGGICGSIRLSDCFSNCRVGYDCLSSGLGSRIRTTDDDWNGPFDLAGDIAPIFSQDGAPRDGSTAEHSRRYAMFIGQSIFTPKNLTLKPPDPRDRPYAGWLYAGTSLLQESNRHMLENLELDLGVVGPGSLARQTQNDFHQFIGVAQAKGWSHEIQTEPGGMLTYERLYHVPLLGTHNDGVDIVPQYGATVGNVMTYGDAGALLRIGKNLQADYGPARIRPALSGKISFWTGTLSARAPVSTRKSLLPICKLVFRCSGRVRGGWTSAASVVPGNTKANRRPT